MSDICVRAERLSKYFLIIKNQKTVLGAMKSLLRGESARNKNWALRDISFQVKKGEKIAIVGRNGSGKTTLLRVLTGIYEKTSGSLSVEGMPLALFDLTGGLNGDLSVIDNIYLFGAMYGVPRDIVRHNVRAILEMSELSRLKYLAFKELSSGQSRKIALSIFFHVTSDFMIIDEGLTAVDRAFSQTCAAHLQNIFSPEKTIIMSSHETDFLRKFFTRAIWLENGHLRMDGGIEEVVNAYKKSCRV